jgi:uncharacterized protein (TIGR00730 family)
MKVAVYLGSNSGNDPVYAQAAGELGDWLAANHHTLVYGGARLGLMNVVAEHVLRNHGSVIGVMPSFMIDYERQRDDLTELIVTPDMSSRKKKMMDLADGYLALPGGPGTLEEISEVISSSRLHLLPGRPCMCLNLKGYYDVLQKMLVQMKNAGFVEEDELRDVYFPASVQDASEILERYQK